MIHRNLQDRPEAAWWFYLIRMAAVSAAGIYVYRKVKRG